jgi:hypothetical protein
MITVGGSELCLTRHKCDGVNAFIFDWDKRRLSGWSHAVTNGDEVAVKMGSGKVAILKVKNLNRMSNPSDQYFADLIDVGYEDEI